MRNALVEILHLPVPGQTLGPDREIQVEEFAMYVYAHYWT
jgi:hypothetical protein